MKRSSSTDLFGNFFVTAGVVGIAIAAFLGINLRNQFWDGLGRPMGRVRSSKSPMFIGLGTTVRLQHTIGTPLVLPM
jgi:hypothetical protein